MMTNAKLEKLQTILEESKENLNGSPKQNAWVEDIMSGFYKEVERLVNLLEKDKLTDTETNSLITRRFLLKLDKITSDNNEEFLEKHRLIKNSYEDKVERKKKWGELRKEYKQKLHDAYEEEIQSVAQHTDVRYWIDNWKYL